MMLILRSECGHRPRAEAGGIGAFGVVEFIAGRTKSNNCGERVRRWFGCDLWLYYGFGIEPSDVAEAG